MPTGQNIQEHAGTCEHWYNKILPGQKTCSDILTLSILKESN